MKLKFLNILKRLVTYKPTMYKLKFKFSYIKNKIITYYNDYIPLPFQFKFLYLVFILGPIEDIIAGYYHFGVKRYYKGIKNTSILSSFFLVDVFLYFYSNFNLNLYYILWLYLLILKFIIGIFYAIYFKSKKYPLICLYTYFIPAFWIKDFIQAIYQRWNPYTWIFYIIHNTIIINYFKNDKKGLFYVNILGWLKYIPLFICFIILYYYTIIIAFPTLLLYIILKILTELVIRKGNCSFLFKILVSLYKKHWILFIFLTIISFTYYIYLYTIINFFTLLKLIIIFWWFYRLIKLIIETEGNKLNFANTFSCKSIMLRNSLKGFIIGLYIYIIPYSNDDPKKKLLYSLKEVLSTNTYKSILPSWNDFSKEMSKGHFDRDSFLHLRLNWLGKNDQQQYLVFSSKYFKNSEVTNFLLHDELNLRNKAKAQWMNKFSDNSNIGFEGTDLPEIFIENLYESTSFSTFMFFRAMTIIHQNYSDELLSQNNEIRNLILFLQKNKIKNLENLKTFVIESCESQNVEVIDRTNNFMDQLRHFNLWIEAKKDYLLNNQLPLDQGSIQFSDEQINKSIEKLLLLGEMLET